jgi:hypothetical protein
LGILQPLKLSCRKKLRVLWSTDVFYLWTHQLLLQTQVQTTHFLPATMLLPNVLAQGFQKVYDCFITVNSICLLNVFTGIAAYFLMVQQILPLLIIALVA